MAATAYKGFSPEHPTELNVSQVEQHDREKEELKTSKAFEENFKGFSGNHKPSIRAVLQRVFASIYGTMRVFPCSIPVHVQCMHTHMVESAKYAKGKHFPHTEEEGRKKERMRKIKERKKNILKTLTCPLSFIKSLPLPPIFHLPSLPLPPIFHLP